MYPSPTGIMLFYPLLLRKRHRVVRADGRTAVWSSDQSLGELLRPRATASYDQSGMWFTQEKVPIYPRSISDKFLYN